LRILTPMAVLFATAAAWAATPTSPRQQFGFDIGDDYQLANYTQLVAYWEKLAAESPRLQLVDIGATAEGRRQIMAIVTAPENFARLDRYRDIARRLALAEDVNEAEARALAQEGKAVVWIDGGLHAIETVGSQQLIETSWQLVSRNDEETLRILRDCIILLVPVNPDGLELVADWYMRHSDPLKREYNSLPRLYQKYIGHDNNRDFYMLNQPESVNAARVMYREWFPQIMYNHHQTGPNDFFVFVPPFRDPPNYVFDPLLILGNQTVGLAMHSRLVAEGKPGAAMRDYATYSTWFSGGIRTTGYFHNQIGMLTEMKGHPTPMELAFYPDRQLASNDYPMPIIPGRWHFRQSIDYSITLNYAVLDHASRHREVLQFNRWRMGRNSIERGSTDSWTITPKAIYAVTDAIFRAGDDAGELGHTFRRRGSGVSKDYLAMFRRPDNRDPRGYILPADQPDFPTAVKLANILIKNGVPVHRATAAFSVGGKTYPAGSLVVKTAHAFRPHILDTFEPQDHPKDFLYEGGPPIPPYDSAGYTLAYQMGVRFDRILDGFDGPFAVIEDLAAPLPGAVTGPANSTAYLLAPQANDAVMAVNRLLKAGHDIHWLTEPITVDGRTHPAGTIHIGARPDTRAALTEMARNLGLSFTGIAVTPGVAALKISPVRIGLWDRYGGSMPSGWTRWLLEQFEFDFKVVFAPEFDAGGLADKFDALVFVTGAIPQVGRATAEPPVAYDPETIAAEYRSHLGYVSSARTLPRLREFVAGGGDVLAIGSSTALAYHWQLPVSNHLVDGDGRPLPSEKYFVPGSIMHVRVDNTQPIAYGLPDRVDVMMDESPVLRFRPDADRQGMRQVAWFDSAESLRSGWAWGQDRLFGGTAVARAEMGPGTLTLFGPEILHRAQPHGTFKFFFNALYLSKATPVQLGR